MLWHFISYGLRGDLTVISNRLRVWTGIWIHPSAWVDVITLGALCAAFAVVVCFRKT